MASRKSVAERDPDPDTASDAGSDDTIGSRQGSVASVDKEKETTTSSSEDDDVGKSGGGLSAGFDEFGRRYSEYEDDRRQSQGLSGELPEAPGGCFKKSYRKVRDRIQRAWDEAGDFSSSDSDTVKSGNWDHWKAYYCAQGSTRYQKFSRSFFSWALILAIGKITATDLIECCINNGGSAFLVVLVITYIGIGYPILVLETMMGQYSGRKPLQLFRYLCPALSGLGPAVYFRTLIYSMYKAAVAMYSFNYCNDLFFCRMNTNKLLAAFHYTSIDYPEFELGVTSRGIFQMFSPWILIVFFFLLFAICSLRAELIGRGYRLAVSLLFLVLIWYTATGLIRAKINEEGTITRIPLDSVFYFDSSKLIEGKTWMNALTYTMNSLGIGTLVFPYLGSQLFFHYRVSRDIAILIALTFTWNLLSMIGIIIWLGYICVNETQMRLALQQIGGPYGIFVTFAMKHNQANMVSTIEEDVLFFSGFYYFIYGSAALLSLVCYIQILVSCTYPEKATMRVKVCILALYCFLFTIVLPYWLFTDEALRHFVYADYYFVRSWSIYFVLGCFFWSVAYSHNFAKFIYDYRNMHHYKILPPGEVSSRLPKLIRVPALVCIFLAMIYSMLRIQHPVCALSEFGYLGFANAFSCIPVLMIIIVGGMVLGTFQGKFARAFKPHRDWYKNHFHNRRCFNEEPPPGEKKKKNKHTRNEANNTSEKAENEKLPTEERI